MMPGQRHFTNLGQSSFWRWVNRLSLVAVVLVMVTVVYGLALRATFERSYWVACILAVLAALFVLVALAQQTIAARDEATWREMAEWQLKAATDKVAANRRAIGQSLEGLPSSEDDDYYEQLLTALIDNMRQPGAGDH